MNRRGFLGSILALGAAPAIVKVANLMPVRSSIIYTLPDSLINPRFIPEIWSTKIAEKFYAASLMDIYTSDAAGALAGAIDRDVLEAFKRESAMTM